jgi:hypothetical protein
VFSSVPEANAQTRQLRGVLHGLGASPATPVTILSDGTDGPRSLGQAGVRLAETIGRIRWRLWHGQVRRALDLIAETVVIVEAPAADMSPMSAAARKVTRLLGDLETYVSGQSDIVIDYATARRREEPISTATTESTVQCKRPALDV